VTDAGGVLGGPTVSDWLPWASGPRGSDCLSRRASCPSVAIACPPRPGNREPGLLSEDSASQCLDHGRPSPRLCHWRTTGLSSWEKQARSLLERRARGPKEDELALSLNQERLRSWVPRWSHQPPTAEAALDRVPPELTLQVTVAASPTLGRSGAEGGGGGGWRAGPPRPPRSSGRLLRRVLSVDLACCGRALSPFLPEFTFLLRIPVSCPPLPSPLPTCSSPLSRRG
jgi:hypothetical protein